jgi:glycerol-3-phosphate dehydrogenase
VVPRLTDHDRCYLFQNADGRIFFAIPYERDFTLIGTTDRDYQGDPAAVAIAPDEIDYLCAGASEYFAKPIRPADVVWSFSGVRPLYDDGASVAQEATRDYVLTLDAPAGEAALLSVFGGKITTYRRLAETALDKLAPHLPAATARRRGWTGHEALPGGDFQVDEFDALVAEFRGAVPGPLATRLARAYGTRARRLLDGVRCMDDLGEIAGADLTHAEIRYLRDHEWARSAADIAWRRSKLGLRLGAAQLARIDELLSQ